MEKFLLKYTPYFVIFCTIYYISSFALTYYILPEVAIYIHNKNKKTKISCTYYYPSLGGTPGHFKINGESYFNRDLSINNWLSRQKNDFPIELKRKQFAQDAHIAREQHKCLFVEYVTVIDLPFWKQIYFYDYSFNPADLKNNHNK